MVGADVALPVVGPYEGTRYWAEVDGQTNLVRCGIVNPEYFRALGIPLKRGRGFTDGDGGGALPVVLVNESFVGRYLVGKEPIGQRIRCGDPETDWNWRTIVGVAGDVREPGGYWGDFTLGTYRAASPTEAAPRVYFCYLGKLASSAVFPDIAAMLPDEENCPKQIEFLRRLTPEQRWNAAYRLYWTVRRHKAAFLQSQHTDWSNERVQAEVRRVFLHART
jgi:hypothetical protein